MGKPSTKSLIGGNQRLSKLSFPYSENYPYYKLADKFQISLEMILAQADMASPNSKRIQINQKQLPNDIPSYARHHQGEVAYAACQNLVELLYELVEYVLSKGKSPFSWLDLEVIESLSKTHNYTTKPFKWGVVRDFWIRARSCTELAGSIPAEHTGLRLLDLIAACSGYKDFADFLRIEFGEDYDPKKDNILQALIASASKPASLVSTKQSLTGSFLSYFTQAARRINQIKGKKKKSLKPLKAKTEKSRFFGPMAKGNWDKVIKLVPVSLVILLGSVVIFMLTSRVKETQVNVTLTTRHLHFQVDQATSLRSTGELLLASRSHLSMTNALYSLDYPFDGSLPTAIRIKPVMDGFVGVEYIAIPHNAKVTIEAPTKKDLYIGFSESEGMNGFIRVDHSIIFSPEETDSVISNQSFGGTGINFQSHEDQRSDISLIEVDDFEWSPLFVKSVSFGELKQDQVEYGIETAQIDFLDNGKSIQLNRGDLLSIAFESPLKLLIKYHEGLISLQFTGPINGIYAGSEIFGRSSSNNQMPKLWEERKEILGMAVIVLVMIFLVVMMSKSRERQPI